MGNNFFTTPFNSMNGGKLQTPFFEEVCFDSALGKEEPLPEGLPENLSALYSDVQSRLRWKANLLDFRFIPGPGFDIFSLVPEELKDRDSRYEDPPTLRDCCQLLGKEGETLYKVPRRKVLYYGEYFRTRDGLKTVLKEGISVRDAFDRVHGKKPIYGVLYRQYLNGQLMVAILHIDERGSALRLPE